MDEGYAEDNLDFSGRSDGELWEIVNSGSDRYRQELVDGAKHELEKRKGDNVPAESNQQVMVGGVQPPVLLENVSGRQAFSIGQIALASLLGPPIAGCLLVAHNYRALGKGRSAWQPLAIGVAATVLLAILAFFLPEKFPNLVLPAGSCLGTYFYAKRQEDAVNNYLKAGGKSGSWWVMIAVSLSCAVITIVLMVAIAITFDIKLPGEETSQPVAKVKVSQAGQIELDGTNVTLEELRVALTSLRDEYGVVWYYRERPEGPAPAAAEKVIRIIANAQLPVRMSSKPDFSDYIDAEGKSVPAP